MEELYNLNNLYRNIKENGLTSLTGKFILIAVVINSKGASSNVAKIYDDIEGEETPERIIATIDTTSAIGRLNYGLPIYNGINIRTVTGTAPDITIIYRKMNLAE
jgi:hypothetical protein